MKYRKKRYEDGNGKVWWEVQRKWKFLFWSWWMTMGYDPCDPNNPPQDAWVPFKFDTEEEVDEFINRRIITEKTVSVT